MCLNQKSVWPRKGLAWNDEGLVSVNSTLQNKTDGVQKFLISTPRAKALLQKGSKQDQDMERVI